MTSARRPARCFVPVLEAEQRGFEGREIHEVAGRQHLALDHGKVDLDLIQPAGMDRSMDRHQARVFEAKAMDAPRRTMRRAIVQDPEDAASLVV